MNLRLTAAVLTASATALAVTVAGCSSHGPAGMPLTITNYKGADWITDGTIKPPTGAARADRIRWPHTMDGAVMAAVDAQTLLDTADDANFGAVERDYFAVGEGHKAYDAARAQIGITGDPNPAKLPRVKGFRFTAYTETSATVEVVFLQPDQSVTGLTRHVVWLGDTWLIQLPAPNTPDKTVTAYDAVPADINPLPQT